MAEVWGWEAFFHQVLSFLRQLHLENASQDQLQYYLERLEMIMSSTERIKSVLLASQPSDADEVSIFDHYGTSISEFLLRLSGVYTEIDRSLDNYLSRSAAAYQPSTLLTGRRGRPRFEITANQLVYLTSLSFTWKKIASMLSISRMTLYRRRVEFGMVHHGRDIRDGYLVLLVQEMRSEFPEMGEVMVLGRLQSLGYSVIRDRVRRAIHETDPINTALRAITGPLVRRVYSVPGPNSLWHVGTFRLGSGYMHFTSMCCFFLQTATTS